jgi:rod shape determining protein RodA
MWIAPATSPRASRWSNPILSGEPRLLSLARRHWRDFDWVLFGALLLTTAFGLAVTWGTTHHVPRLAHYPARQAMWWAVGLVAFVVTLLIDHDWLRRLAWVGYGGVIVLLVALFFQSGDVRGTKSWMALPGGFRFQPSELAKLAVVAVLARLLSEVRVRALDQTAQLRLLCVVGVIVGLPMVLTAAQPDLGTAVVFIPVTLILLTASGFSRRILLLILLVAVLGGFALYPFLREYQRARVTIHWNPESDPRGRGYNIIQAKIALGSGGALGKGLGEGTQSYFGFLPEHHTDFVFNSLGEQLGFVGCLALLGLYGLMIGRSLGAATLARNHFGALLAVGLCGIFATHALLNILIATQILPVTGLPLPLMSVGGTFLVAIYVIFGLIENIRMRRHHY